MRFNQITGNISRVIKLAWQHNKNYLFFSFLQIISNAIFPLINIIFLAFLIDGILEGNDLSYIIRLIIVFVIATLIVENLTTISNNYTKVYGKAMMIPMSTLFCKKSIEMDYQYTEDEEILGEMSRASFVLVNGDNLEYYLNSINSTIIAFLQMLITFIIVLTIVNPIIFVVIFVISSFNIVINLRAQNKNFQIHRDAMDIDRKWRYLIDVGVNLLYGKTIRLYDLKSYILGKKKKNRNEFGEAVNRFFNNERNANVGIDFFNSLQEGIVLVFLVFQVLLGRLSIGNLTAVIGASKQFSTSFITLFSEMTNMYKNDNYINDFFIFLKRENNLRNDLIPDGLISKEKSSEIIFKDVSFKYPKSDRYVLHNINLTIKPGEKITLVGENGAGKSTLIKLLMRLYDPTEGEILYNGSNIKEYNYDEYMDVFSTVFQDYKVFALNVYDNIAFYPQNQEQRNKIDEILIQNNMLEKIRNLPHGSDTILSRQFDEEKGVELSGGQQQQIALCRAIYKDSPIVILDEPTASLSPIAEYNIYRQFDNMVKGKTAIYVSHRLSSSKISDKICVLDSGEISEYGTHSELMELDGLYRKMFALQSQYYKDYD